MKIAIVVQRFPVVSETFVINHVVSLINAGCDVTVLSMTCADDNSLITHPQFSRFRLEKHVVYAPSIPQSWLPRILKSIKILIYSLRKGKGLKVFHLLNFFRFGKKAIDLSLLYYFFPFIDPGKFDIIHCHFGHVGNIVQIFRKLNLITGKLVVSFHGFEFLDKQVVRSNRNYKDVFSLFDGVVANSRFTRDTLFEMGCSNDKLFTIPVIPNNEIFSGGREIEIIKRNDFFKILTIARLVEKKGLKEAIAAIEILIYKYGYQIEYNIIGHGPLLEELKVMVVRKKLQNVIHFRGALPQDKVAEQLSFADCFLLSSIIDDSGDTETQGLVLIEAQMMEVPIVCSDVGGIPDSVYPNKSAFVVPQKDPEAMAQSIAFLYENESARREMGAAGKAYAAANFNPELLTNKLISLYKSLLSL